MPSDIAASMLTFSVNRPLCDVEMYLLFPEVPVDLATPEALAAPVVLSDLWVQGPLGHL